MHIPEMAIAFGAAKYAADIRVQLRSNTTYGLVVYGKNEPIIKNYIIAGRTVLPAEVTIEFRDNRVRSTTLAPICAHSEKTEASDYSTVSAEILKKIPMDLKRYGKISEKMVTRMILGEDEILHFEMKDAETGKSASASVSIAHSIKK